MFEFNSDEEIIPGSEKDPDNPSGILARLENRVPASFIPGKIVKIPRDKVKFLCPNHPMRVVIEMKESNLRDKRHKLEEFTCSCGTIYKKVDKIG